MIEVSLSIGALVVAVVAVFLMFQVSRQAAEGHARMMAQAEECWRGRDRLVEKLTNKLLAVKAPHEYAQYRQMSMLPEVTETPTPEHTVNGQRKPSMREKLLAQRNAELQHQVDTELGPGVDDDLEG